MDTAHTINLSLLFGRLLVLEKFVSPSINLTPHDKEDTEGNMLPALSNLRVETQSVRS